MQIQKVFILQHLRILALVTEPVVDYDADVNVDVHHHSSSSIVEPSSTNDVFFMLICQPQLLTRMLLQRRSPKELKWKKQIHARPNYDDLKSFKWHLYLLYGPFLIRAYTISKRSYSDIHNVLNNHNSTIVGTNALKIY